MAAELSDIAELQATIATLTAEKRQLTTVVGELIQTLEASNAEKATLRANAAECNDHVKALNAQIAELRTNYRSRPPVMRGRTVQANVGCGPLYITLNEDDRGRPFEVFFKLGKSGSCQQSYLEALGVAMSVGLRYGADPQKYIDKFRGMRCPNPKMRIGSDPQTLSCADGISQGLAKALEIAVALPGLEHALPAVGTPKATLHEPVGGLIDLIAPQVPAEPISTHTRFAEPEYGQPLTKPQMGRAVAHGGGVGVCPDCSANLIAVSGCQMCSESCGYTGKC